MTGSFVLGLFIILITQRIVIALVKHTAAEVMTRDPVTTKPETPLLEALQMLLAQKVKRLPVVDDGGRLVGLVGRGGILEALARDL